MNKKIILYGITLFLILVFSYIFIDKNFIFLQPFYTGYFILHREFSAMLFLCVLLVLFGWYFYYLRLIRTKSLSLAQIKKIIVVTIAVLFFSYPAMLSFDIFNYTTTAQVAFKYKENPYITMPIEFTNETFLQYTRAANKKALYGPFWILLTGIPYLMSGLSFLSFLFSLKALIVFFYAGVGYLIWKLTKSAYSVTFFMLNPLVVVETIVSSHNDVVMMFFALLALYLLQNKQYSYSLLSLILSFFIKYATVLLFPIWIYVMVRQNRKASVNWHKIYIGCGIAMTVAFLASPIREEIYSWYFIWILCFSALCAQNKYIRYVSMTFSFSLMLRYLPVLYTGSYFGYTPIIKNLLTFTVPVLVAIINYFYNNIWLKKLSH